MKVFQILPLGLALIAAQGWAAPQAQVENLTELERQATQSIKALGAALQHEMKSAMKQGGPLSAIGACNTQAAPLTAKISDEQGLQIGRTAQRIRNPENRPDSWEAAVMEQFQQRQANGEPFKGMRFSEVVEQHGQREFRMMMAIPTQQGCLKCHGNELDPRLAEQLDQLYPEDQARGFSEGQLRGAFTVRKAL